MATLGAFLAMQSEPTGRVFGWIALLFFFACGMVGARQLFRTEPVIEIDDRGILWRRWSDTPVPWPAITRAGMRTMRGQTFLCLWLRDPAAYRSTRLLGRLAGANSALGFGDIALSTIGTDRGLSALVAAVAARVDVEKP